MKKKQNNIHTPTHPLYQQNLSEIWRGKVCVWVSMNMNVLEGKERGIYESAKEGGVYN